LYETAVIEIFTISLHGGLPICRGKAGVIAMGGVAVAPDAQFCDISTYNVGVDASRYTLNWFARDMIGLLLVEDDHELMYIQYPTAYRIEVGLSVIFMSGIALLFRFACADKLVDLVIKYR